ncbi:unnamed protein product, partial [Vitis vinifera]
MKGGKSWGVMVGCTPHRRLWKEGPSSLQVREHHHSLKDEPAGVSALLCRRKERW